MASALPSPVPAIVVPPPSFAVCPRAFPDAKFIVAMATNPPVIAVGEGGAPDSQEPVEQLLVGLTRIHTFGPHRVHTDVEAPAPCWHCWRRCWPGLSWDHRRWAQLGGASWAWALARPLPGCPWKHLAFI